MGPVEARLFGEGNIYMPPFETSKIGSSPHFIDLFFELGKSCAFYIFMGFLCLKILQVFIIILFSSSKKVEAWL